jgi:hypothetical protein
MSARHERSRSRSRCRSGCVVLCVLCALLVVGLSAPASASASFPDVPDNHPYFDAIQDMAGRGIINGFGDGRFKPDDPVARQQFAKMIMKAVALPVSEADICPFTDVEANLDPRDPLYANHYVAACASYGITTGFTPTIFHPYSNMSVAQLITMVARSDYLSEPPSSYSPPFGNFDPTHYPWALRAAYAGLLDGIVDMTGDPVSASLFWAAATRGQVCQVLHNLLERRTDYDAEMSAALAASGMVADDFEIWDHASAGSYFGAIVVSPTRADTSVLLTRGTAGWWVLFAADNWSYEEWLATGAPQNLASYLSRDADLDAIADVLRGSGNFDPPFHIRLYLFHGAHAGVILSSPGLEDCYVYMFRGLKGWAAMAFGTGLTYEDWLAAGAPTDIAGFLSPAEEH